MMLCYTRGKATTGSRVPISLIDHAGHAVAFILIVMPPSVVAFQIDGGEPVKRKGRAL